jgi:UDP-N-acetylmuramoyl-L-alanyl-D-glutamate--2,6-diaminopimelate ligase
MARLFDAWYGHPGRRLRLVGVTGTNGKTTVSFLLYHMLQAAGRPAGIIGTLGAVSPGGPVDIRPADERAAMTTPDPEELYAILERMVAATPPDETATVVMEVSSHALALGKVEPLCFDLSVFTNLSPEHLDFHGTVEAYFEAKQQLFAHSRRGVINGDDPWARRLPSLGFPVEQWMICRSTPVTSQEVGICPGGACDCCLAEQIRSLGLLGMEYRLTTPDARLRLTCPIPGQFSVMNSMEAAVAALSLGVSPGEVKDSLASFPGVPGRLERILPRAGYEADFSVFIDFAHTPMALENLLLTFQNLRQGGDQSVRRLVVLFGCGGDRDRSKRRAMAHTASRMADVVVVTSDNSRSEDPLAIIRDILTGIDRESEYAVIPDRAEAIRYTIRYARPGDVILLCGKGHETYEIDRTGRHPFSERDIALAAAARRERGGN